MEQDKLYLYRHVYEELKQEILSGKYALNELLPSERLLCERFGVWRATVRKALDMLCADKLVEKKAGVGTRVICSSSEDAWREQAANKRVIGFFIADGDLRDKRLSQPYYSDLLYYLDAACNEHNCRILYATVTNPADMLNVLQSNSFVFVVFLAHKNFECLSIAREFGVPTALINERYRDFMTISCDHARGGYIALKHLFKNGHKRIGIISGPADYMSTQDKIAGCRRACYEYNVPFPSGDMFCYGDWEYESGYNCAKKMFGTQNKELRPTALFAFNDSMCIGAMRAIRELGYNIPRDVSIIGSDNMKQLEFSEPKLTTVDTGIERTAEAIVTCAIHDIASKLGSEIKLLTPVSLAIRETVLDINPDKIR